MSRKVFTAGEVLAAADVNSFLMDQTVMSFAGTAARGSAIGTATEGMVTYLEDIDSLSVNNGTAWTTDRTIQVFGGTAARGSAIPSPVEGMTTYLQDADRLDFYDGSSFVPASGLNFIKSETFTAVSSVSFNNIFSTTYRDYLFLFSGVHTTGEAGVLWRLRSAGSDDSTANYFFGSVDISNTGGPTRSYVGSATNGYVANVRDLRGSFSFTISDPATTARKMAMSQSTTVGTLANVFLTGWSTANIQSTFDGITFLLSGGAFTGTIKVYGYRS